MAVGLLVLTRVTANFKGAVAVLRSDKEIPILFDQDFPLKLISYFCN